MLECDECGAMETSRFYLSEEYPRICLACWRRLNPTVSYDANFDDDVDVEFDFSSSSIDPVFEFASSIRSRNNIGGLELLVGMKKQIMRRGAEIQKQRKELATKDAIIDQLRERLDRERRSK